MKRPSFQFYPGDWTSNAKLRRCTHAQRGIWLAVLCTMHDSDDYGVLRWPLEEIARAVGCRRKDLADLAAMDILKGADDALREPFIFTPRHAGKDGEPVTLIPAQDGPIWFSSRMVRDEYIRKKRGGDTRFGVEPKTTPKPPIGDGPSSSSSSSIALVADAGRKKRKTAMPEGFEVTDQMAEWAAQIGIQPDRLRSETEKFADHHRAKGSTFIDWPAAWRTWMRNAVEFAKR